MGLHLESGFLYEIDLLISLFSLYLCAMMKKKTLPEDSQTCNQFKLAIRDTMDFLSGKWKIQIIGTLLRNDTMRFMDLLREVDGIAAKMLSKELQDLEQNALVKREVLNTKPITVQYSITEYGITLKPVIEAIAGWGIEHRRVLFGDVG